MDAALIFHNTQHSITRVCSRCISIQRTLGLHVVRGLGQGLELPLVRAGEFLNLDSVGVQLERGHGGDAALRGDVVEVVHVDLDEDDVGVLGGEFLEVGADLLAWAAPGRGEVDEDLGRDGRWVDGGWRSDYVCRLTLTRRCDRIKKSERASASLLKMGDEATRDPRGRGCRGGFPALERSIRLDAMVLVKWLGFDRGGVGVGTASHGAA